MKLKELVRCDIYRDGGSLEGVWLTDENKEWVIALRIQGWNQPSHYDLFQYTLDDTIHRLPILKGSTEHIQIMTLVNNWVSENKIQLKDFKMEELNCNRLYDLLIELEKGDY